MWFNNAGSYLYRLTDVGAQLSYPLSSPPPDEVASIAFAPGGTPWFTEYAPNALTGAGCCGQVGELAGGVAHLTPIGSQHAADGIEPDSLTVGFDGALWFAFHKAWSGAPNGDDGIGRIDPATGGVQLLSTDPYVPSDIAFGSDGALWFVDGGANVVGRIATPATLFGPAPTPTPGRARRAPAITLTLPTGRTAAIGRTATLRIGCRLASAGRCSVSASVTAAVARRLGLKPPRHAKMLSLAHRSAVLAPIRAHDDHASSPGPRQPCDWPYAQAHPGGAHQRVELSGGEIRDGEAQARGASLGSPIPATAWLRHR